MNGESGGSKRTVDTPGCILTILGLHNPVIFPLPFLSSSLLLFLFITLSLPFHSFHLKVGPLNTAGGAGSVVSSPSGVWGGAPANYWILVHYRLKISQASTILMIFLRVS